MRYILVVLILMITGCTTTYKNIDEFTLLYQNNPTTTNTQTNSSISIAPIKTKQSLNTKNLIYLYQDGSIGSYQYSRWSDTPSVMLEQLITQKIQDAKIFSSVAPLASQSKSDYMLESYLDSFYHNIEQNKSDGYINISCRLIDISQKKVISQQQFKITSPSKSIDAKGAIQALQNGSNALTQEVVLWIEKTLRKTDGQ